MSEDKIWESLFTVVFKEKVSSNVHKACLDLFLPPPLGGRTSCPNDAISYISQVPTQPPPASPAAHPPLRFVKALGLSMKTTPNSILLLLLGADPLCRWTRSHLFLGDFMPGQLHAAPRMTAGGKQKTWDRPATAPATCGDTLGSTLCRYQLCYEIPGNSPTLAKREKLRGKTETQQRRRKWGTEGTWPYDVRAHRECSGLPLAACHQLVWWCLENATASQEKTAGNREKELGKHRFT